MKISKKFKKLSLIILLLSTVFALNTHNVFGMAEPIKKENPATALMPSSRLDYLIAQIKSNPALQQQFEIIGNLREQFLITALKESCFRYHQAENILNPVYTSDDEGSSLRKQTTQKTIEALQRAENAYFDANPLVQELVDQIELAAQIHHAKEIAHALKEAQAQFDYKNLKERFTYTVIKDIVSKEMLSNEDHLKYLFSKDYFTKFKLIDINIPFMLSIPYFTFLNKSYNSILGRESTFTLETLYKTNPESLHKILTISKRTRGYNLKLITLKKIDQFLLTQKSFGNTQQEKCLRRLHENKKQKFKEIQTKIVQDTYSLQELEDQTNLALEGLPENLRTKVLFLIQCELENQSGKLLDKYFDYLKALTDIQDADLLLAKEIIIENLSTLDIEDTILHSWLKEILKPKLKIEEIAKPQDHKKVSRQKKGRKTTGKKQGRASGPNKNKPKPIDIDRTKKGAPELKPVVVDKQTLPPAVQPPLADRNLAQITQQISELTLLPKQQVMQNDPSTQDDYAHRNCIYDLSRGIFNGHQIKLLVFNGLQDTKDLLQNLDYSFLEQHGKILRTFDNNHSFSKLIEKSFGSLGTIIESKELATHEMQSMIKTYGNSLNFEQYKYKITIHIPGKITGLYCSTDFANKLGPNGNFEFVILQRNSADSNPLCVHRFFKPLNYVEQPAFA